MTGSLSTIPLPPSVNELNQWVLPHISTMAADLDEEASATLFTRLRNVGVPYPELTLRTDQDSSLAEELVETHPNDHAIQAYWLLSRRMIQSTTPPERFGELFELFREDYPELAFITGIYAYQIHHKEAEDLLKASLALSDGVKPIALILQSLGSLLVQNTNAPGSLSDAHRKTILEILENWQTEADEMYQPQIFTYRASATRQDDDLRSFVRLLDEEMIRSKEAKNASIGQANAHVLTNYRITGISRTGDRLITALTFHEASTQFPANILNLISGGDAYGIPIDSEALILAVDEAKDPFLRAAIAYTCEDHERTTAILTEILETEEPPLDAYLISAVLASDRGDFKLATNRLTETLLLPLEKETRIKVEASLVSYALETDPDEAVLASGREAALRLRRMTLQQGHREELAQALSTLGLEEEAARLRLNNTSLNSMSVASATRAAVWPTLSTRQPGGQVQKLIEDNRYDRAAARAAQELKGHASSYLMSQNMDTSFYEARDLVQLIHSHSLTQEVLESASPDTQNRRQLAQYAMICQLLDAKEQAVKLFSQILELHPQDEAVRMRLFLLKVEEDPESAVNLLLELPPSQMQTAGNAIYRILANEQRMEHKVKLTQSIIRVLEQIEDIELPNLSWCNSIVQALGQQYYGDDVQLPSLYSRFPQIMSSDQEKSEEAEAQRRKIHDDLCMAMLRIPQLARGAFTLLTARPLFEGQETLDYEALAKKSLLTHRSQSPGGYAPAFSMNDSIPLYDPTDYLIENAWRNNTLSTLQEEFFPELIEAGNDDIVELMEQRIQLYTCNADEFMELTNSLLKEIPPSNSNGIDYLSTTIISVWEQRNLDVDLQPLFEQILKDSRYRYRSHSWIAPYALAVSKEPNALNEFLSLLANHFLGPEEKRVSYIKKYYNPNSGWSSNSPMGAIMAYVEILTQLSQSEALIFPALQEYIRYGLDANDRYRSRSFTQILNQYSNSDLMERLLKHSPYLGEIDDFRLFPLPNIEKKTFFSALMQAIERDDMTKRAIQKLIADQETPTFGSKMIGAYLDENPARFAEQLVDFEEDLRALTEGHRREFIILIDEYYPENQELPELSERAAAFLAEYRSFTDTGNDAAVAEFLAHKHYADVQTIDLDDHTQKLLHYLSSQKDVQRSKDVFIKYVELVEDGVRTQSWRRSYGDNVTHAGYFLNRVLQNSQDPYHDIPLVLELLSSPVNQQSIEMNASRIRNLISPAINKYLEDVSDHSIESHLPIFQKIYSSLATAIGDRPCALIGPHLSRLFDGVGDQRIDEIVIWLEENEENRALSLELAMAARLRKELNHQKSESSDILSVAQQHYFDVVNDKSFPLSWRLTTIEALLNLSNSHLSPRLIISAANVLSERWESSDNSVSTQQAQVILNAFTSLTDRDNASWKSGAGKLAESWLQAQLRNTNRRTNSVQTRFISSLLEASLLSESHDVTNRIVSLYAPTLAQNAEILMLLIKHEEFERAKFLVRKGWSTMEGNYGEHLYTSEIEAKLDRLLVQIERPDLRYFTEVLIKNAPDANEDNSEDVTPRMERLKDLALRFSHTEFSARMLEERCLHLLGSDYAVSELLAEHYARIAVDIDLGALMNINDDQLKQRRSAFVAAHITHTIAQGELEPFFKQFDSVMKGDAQSDYYRRDPLLTLVNALIRGVTAALPNYEEDDYRDVLPAFHRVFEVPEQLSSYVSQWSELSNLVLATYTLSDDLEGFSQWYASLPEDTSNRIRSSLSPNGLFALIASGSATSEDDHTQSERINLLSDLGSHPALKDKYYIEPNFFTGLEEQGYLSLPTLLKHSKTLLESQPREGRTAEEIARILDSEERWSESVPFWHEAIIGTGATVNGSFGRVRYGAFYQGKARGLRQLDRRQEALLTLESANWDLIDSGLRSAYENEVDSLKKECEEAGLTGDSTQLAVEQLSKHPNDNLALGALVSLYTRHGDRSRAEEELKAASAYYQLALLCRSRITSPPYDFKKLPITDVADKLMEIELELGRIKEHHVLIATGSEWRYFDQGTDLGSKWKEVDYNDNDWKTGKAKLGYSDNPVTTISYGDSSNSKHITAYFRLEFQFDQDLSSVALLLISLLRDDGAVVYLNGDEILRDNMPEGEINYTTGALATVSNTDESRFFSFSVDPASLREGKNILAVEIHQTDGRSSDAGFDFALQSSVVSPEDILASTDRRSLIEIALANGVPVPNVLLEE